MFESGIVVFLVLLGVAIAGGIIYVSYHQNKKRREAMQAFAHTYGWDWTQEDGSFARRWEGQPFGRGSSRKARNIVAGQHRDVNMVVFDYSYVTRTSGANNSSSSSTHKFTVWVIRMRAALPHLELGPEGVFGGRVAAAFGMADLQVGDEAFDRAYKVRSDDEEFGRAVLHEGMRAFLLGYPSTQLRFDGNSLVCWEKGTADAELIVKRLDFLRQFLAQVPHPVWERYGQPA